MLRFFPPSPLYILYLLRPHPIGRIALFSVDISTGLCPRKVVRVTILVEAVPMLTDAPATSVSPPAILSPFAQMNTSSSSGDVEALAAKLYTEMVDDLVQDLTFLAVKSMKRARQPCSVCHTK